MNYYNYFTEIEEHFVRRRGKHLLISPMDWSLIATWRDSGIPLHVALRGIDVAMDGFFAKTHRGTSKINSLFYCHDSVMAEYTRHLESHLGESSSNTTNTKADIETETAAKRGHEPDLAEVLQFISNRIIEINALCAKRSFSGKAPEGLERILLRLKEIGQALKTNTRVDLEALERDLGILDELLVMELRTILPPERIAEWEQEAKRELKVYRKRLPSETYEQIRKNFMRGKIHRMFDVGELSLFHL